MKQILLLLLAVFALTSLTAQQALKVEQTDDKADFALSELHKITFDEDEFSLHLNDGTVLTYSITDIQKLAFGEKSTTGIDKQKQNNNEVSLFPNPVKDFLQFKINSDSPINISIISLQGEILLEHRGKLHQEKVDVSKLNSGIYLIQIEIEHQTNTKIFIKQ